MKIVFQTERTNKIMANCLNCKYSYVEDIWGEPACEKGKYIRLDEDGYISDEEFECKWFEED